MKKIKIILTSIIAVILIFIILSNNVLAVKELKDIGVTRDLAELAANGLGGTVGQLFTLNAKTWRNKTEKGLKISGEDISFKSTMCMFHSQSTEDDDMLVAVSNVIEVDSSGGVVVYNPISVTEVSSGTVGTKTQSGNQITEITELTQPSGVKKYKVTYLKKSVDLSTSEEKDMRIMSYIMNKAMGYDDEPGSDMTKEEKMLYWLWYDRIKSHLSGSLDSYFNYTPSSYTGYTASIYNEAVQATSTTSASLSLSKGNTTPEVYYGDDGVAYIGPLQVNYTSGTTSIKVQTGSKTISAGWSTKNSDGTFNKKQSGNVTSGQIFYAVVDESAIKDAENVKVKVSLSSSGTGYSSRIVLTNNKTQGGQNLMYFAGYEEKSSGSKEVYWQVENQKLRYADIIIQKEGANGSRLENVEFSLWRSTGPNTGYLRLVGKSGFVASISSLNISDYDVEYVSSLSKATKFCTDSSGEITISNLEVGKGNTSYKFNLAEEENIEYGYKSAEISGVTINGESKTTDSRGDIIFSVDESLTEIRLLIENDLLLGNLELTKYGDDEEREILSEVEFVVKSGNNYIQLVDASGNIKSSITGSATISTNNIAQGSYYAINYVTNQGVATKFVTDSSGKIVINNLEVYSSGGSKYTYTFVETSNNNYAYEITANIGKETQTTLTANTTTNVSMTNKGGLGNLEIIKQGDTVLSNVEFIVQREEGTYIQLIDASGNIKSSITGSATIGTNNIAQGSSYKVNYITNQGEATKFITDSLGKIIINNLEVFKEDGTNYKYTIIERLNPNYGYGSRDNLGEKSTNNTLSANAITSVNIENKQDIGNLIINKKDDSYTNISLPEVEFIVEIGNGKYIQLENASGIITSIVGSLTINKNNIAQGSEYEVNYVSSTGEATKFMTDSNGDIVINNLEKYSLDTGEEYTYKVTEISNKNYGYDITINGTIVELGETTTLGNEQKYIKISGYVWLENSSGKTNTYDCLYTNSEIDQKLTDIYSTDGSVILNTNAKIPVEIKLCDKSGNVVKSKPDEFDATGKYIFNDIEVANLSNYQVVFVYDGFYYAVVTENLDKDNGSKVSDIQTDRINLNNKFATVKDNSQVLAEDGSVNGVTYTKDGHTSILSDILLDTTVKANTSTAEYSLSDALHNLKKSPNTTTVECIDSVNMGIVLREQPKLSINSDIYSVLVGVNGYNYNYKYNGRQNYYENKNGDGIGVKFEQEYVAQRYTRTVYASDIQAASEQNKNINVEVTYKLQLANESNTLKIIPKQIINYFDSRYSIKAIGISYDNNNHTTIQALGYSSAQEVTGHSEYSSTIIDFNQEVKAGKGNVKEIYITFILNRDAIMDLLNQRSTYHNASEVLSYASYYGTDTTQFITDTTSAGNIYAGIDKMSQPGNMEISLITHPSGGTDILDTTYYEDDTTSAPSLILEKSEVRMISGNIWEDTDTDLSDNERLGDGKYNKATEKPISNVKISLHKVNSDGSIDPNVATYSDGTTLAETWTDESGKYKLGSSISNETYYGVEPGKYVIKYTYNNKSYIVDSNGNKNININDYKSTIITSNIIKNAYESSNPDGKWYLVKEIDASNNIIQYSDARDDITLRKDNDIVKYSTYKDNALSDYVMNAYTPNMDIGIEFTRENESLALSRNLESVVFENEFENIDFGIIERPLTNVEIEKKITGLEIIGQNGANIIPKGDPSNPDLTMVGVKTGLKGIVPVEIETSLLQGAKLNVEYTITIKRDSELDYDYNEENAKYYFYGEKQQNAKFVKITKVVDYLDNTMTITQNTEGLWKNDYDANKLRDEGYISDEVWKELSSGEKRYNIYYTEAFSDMNAEDTKEVKLYATRYLAVSNEISEVNAVEILELSGGRVVEYSTPGNYVPKKSPSELDEDRVNLIITPPTGSNVNYILYIVSAIITTAILLAGIIIIKKKIIK